MAQAAFHGNIGKVEEPKFSNDGQCRIKFSVAEGHSKFDKQQNKWVETGTTWRNVTVFGKRAETLADVLKAGSKQQVVVIGREETREYDKTDGSKGYSFDVVADIVGIIPTPQQQGGQSFGGQQQQGNFGAPAAPAAVDPWATPAPANTGWDTSNQPPF